MSEKKENRIGEAERVIKSSPTYNLFFKTKEEMEDFSFNDMVELYKPYKYLSIEYFDKTDKTFKIIHHFRYYRPDVDKIMVRQGITELPINRLEEFLLLFPQTRYLLNQNGC